MNVRVLSTTFLLSLALMAPPAMAQDDGYDDEKGDKARDDDDEGGSKGGGAKGQGLAFGLRAGFGLPLGKIADTEGSSGNDGDAGGNLGDFVDGIIPAQIDVGYFLNSNLYIGASFQYALGLTADCPEGASCSASDLRFGINASYHIPVSEKTTPWVGLGVGYEILNASAEVTQGGVTAEVDTGLKGLEFLNLQGGVDFNVSGPVWIGPFVTFTVGQYSKASIDVAGTEVSGDIEEKAMHFWLQGGVRLQVRL